MKIRISLASACLALVAMAAAPVQAQTSIVAAGEPSTVADPGSTLFAHPVGSDTLATFRGGAQVRNSMTLDGVTADNSAYQVNTGSNSIGTGSFSNMSGLPIVIQNSGANVLIQNAVILNVQME